MNTRLHLNRQDLKANHLHRLDRLLTRRIRENSVVSQEFARSLCELSHELGRQLGVLIDRQGHITDLIVGDAQRIFIPELDRSRSARMRGLRLVHTHLYQEPLSEEDLYDLTLLRLDYITAITFDEKGIPALFYSAHLLPGSSGPSYQLDEPLRSGQLPENFREVIANLEAEFRREEAELKRAGDRPRALLVGVYTPEMRRKRSPEDSIAELRELCRTAGVEPADTIIQKRAALDPVTVIGSGKAREISIQAVQAHAELLIFDQELSPAQASRLSSYSDLKIIDRTQLILDIFARNARSRDGKLQVELAQLRYLKGRLSEKDDNMSRLTGGIGSRGPGETKLEIGRRRVQDRISRLETELKTIRKRRELNRRRRVDNSVPICSIVGYTNAGKSTLLNALTNSEVHTENLLFATLDPTTRRLRFPEEREIILSDTVGFIHDLPPELSKAFQATLEELVDSTLLLHCIDAADLARDQKIAAVEKILDELELQSIPVIQVYNKADLLTEDEQLDIAGRPNAVLVSAAERSGLERLLVLMEEQLFLSGSSRTPRR